MKCLICGCEDVDIELENCGSAIGTYISCSKENGQSHFSEICMNEDLSLDLRANSYFGEDQDDWVEFILTKDGAIKTIHVLTEGGAKSEQHCLGL